MTNKELAGWLADKEVSQSELARLLGVHRATVCRWLAGDCRIPKSVAMVLEGVKFVGGVKVVGSGGKMRIIQH